jgi:hypothetical protein
MSEEHKQFRIKDAYAFGAERGLDKEIAIREMIIEWDSHTSSLRKGYLVELFEKRGAFDDFKGPLAILHGERASADASLQSKRDTRLVCLRISGFRKRV